MTGLKAETVRKFIETNYGKRCLEICLTCPICMSWLVYDMWFGDF